MYDMAQLMPSNQDGKRLLKKAKWYFQSSHISADSRVKSNELQMNIMILRRLLFSPKCQPDTFLGLVVVDPRGMLQ